MLSFDVSPKIIQDDNVIHVRAIPLDMKKVSTGCVLSANGNRSNQRFIQKRRELNPFFIGK
jgi:hypothetical protein